MLHSLRESLHGHSLQTSAVHLAGFSGVAAEHSRLEHFQTRHSQTLASPVDFAGFFGFVGPVVPGTGIKKNGYQEKIDQSSCPLQPVN